ncbi:MAG: cytochrome c3 family protein [Gammaproteobacteria bacterium]|nr:cytochrome c3 family protein [Gammaproteobacteria bacterium]
MKIGLQTPVLMTRAVARFLTFSVAAVVALSWAGVVPAEEQLHPVLAERGVHFQTEGKEIPVAEDGIHDPNNPAVEVLQPPVEAMAGFPRDSAGIVDWVKALDSGIINPRMGLTGDEVMTAVDFDVIFKNTGSMPYVRYPHRPHTIWLTCSNCHPKIFIPKKGSNPVTMSAIMRGQYCGVCHGKVAFPPNLNCGRCHSVPRDTNLRR